MNPVTHPRFHLTNNYERAVFLRGDTVGLPEQARYQWANQHMQGTSVLDLGCSSGFGAQFLTGAESYLGLDYDPKIIEIAREQHWHHNAKFESANIYTYPLGYYDTIIAFEFIEHFDDGLEILYRLKQHCDCLLITVPHNETPGFWGEHHKLHHLTSRDFPKFKVSYTDMAGNITDEPATLTITNPANLMLGLWTKENKNG